MRRYISEGFREQLYACEGPLLRLVTTHGCQCQKTAARSGGRGKVRKRGPRTLKRRARPPLPLLYIHKKQVEALHPAYAEAGGSQEVILRVTTSKPSVRSGDLESRRRKAIGTELETANRTLRDSVALRTRPTPRAPGPGLGLYKARTGTGRSVLHEENIAEGRKKAINTVDIPKVIARRDVGTLDSTRQALPAWSSMRSTFVGWLAVYR